MRSMVMAASFVLAALAMTPALADPQVKSSDIVNKLIANADMGAKRGICVGTTEECKKNEPAPSGLDMLINFDLNSADLTPQARENLAEFSKALKDQRLSAANFVVEGYTDASGNERYNDKLSERRAESVTSFLLANGINSEKVKAMGMGEKNPRSADPYDPVNRRVEMRIQVQ